MLGKQSSFDAGAGLRVNEVNKRIPAQSILGFKIIRHSIFPGMHALQHAFPVDHAYCLVIWAVD
jgi:hypothetical protein